MIPRSLSATSLETAEGCLARWAVTHNTRSAEQKNEPAMLGTSVHGALEAYVRHFWIGKNELGDLKSLELFYMQAFAEAFGTSELSGSWWDDGLEQLKRWWGRMPAVVPTVASLEVKESFDIPTSAGLVPVTYIFDRMDYVAHSSGDTRLDEVEVVDYKTWRNPVPPSMMAKKIQPRVYALAALHKYPNINKIWVTYDQTRYDTVSRVFTKADCKATWTFIKRVAEKIIAADENNLEEQINSGCHYCVRKATCKTLQSNVLAGGTFGLSLEESIQMHYVLTNKIKAEGRLLDELGTKITTEMAAIDEIEIVEGSIAAKLTYSSRTKPDTQALIDIVGRDLFLEAGGLSVSVSGVNNFLKNPDLTPQQIELIKQRVLVKEMTNPSIKTREV